MKLAEEQKKTMYVFSSNDHLPMAVASSSSMNYHKSLALFFFLSGVVIASSQLPPPAFDWRNKDGKNYVTPVKNQERLLCDDSWAFTAVALVESAFLIEKNISYDLSEQQVLDCGSYTRRSNGCFDGQQLNGFHTIKDLRGLLEEAQYPYTGLNTGICRTTGTSADTFLMILTGFEGGENSLEGGVTRFGPVGVRLCPNDELLTYRGGIYYNLASSTLCSETEMISMVVVGYGTSEDRIPYWILKNSWGTLWGEEGYLKLARGQNMCGISNPEYYVAFYDTH